METFVGDLAFDIGGGTAGICHRECQWRQGRVGKESCGFGFEFISQTQAVLFAVGIFWERAWMRFWLVYNSRLAVVISISEAAAFLSNIAVDGRAFAAN
jgi:hypothetical protein